MPSLGIRARLTIALVTVALFAVALAALIGNLGLTPRLDQAARARLSTSSRHLSHIVADAYANAGGWTPAVRNEITHAGELVDLRVMIRLNDGRIIQTGLRPDGVTFDTPITIGIRSVATLVASSPSGSLLSANDVRLASSLNELHLVAAAIAAVTALLTALAISQTLSRPLRRIRSVAERLSRGELSARVVVGSEPDARDVALALNQLADTLQQEDRLRREGVSDLAHELRTPVNGLLSRIEAAQDNVLPLEANLAAMHDDAVHMTALLNDLARLSDAQQPGISLNRSSLDFAGIVRAALSTLQPRIDERHVLVSLHAERTAVVGDGSQLEQVVINLLTNAIKYSAPQGQVDVTVMPSGTNAILVVRDNGIGISAEDLPFIFTRFWRADRSRSRDTGGTGIGLTIVSELVRAHGGHIDVDSAVGVGTQIRVTVPLSTRDRRPLEPAQGPLNREA